MAVQILNAEEKAIERLTNPSPNEDWVLVSDSTARVGIEEIKKRMQSYARVKPR